MARNQITHAVVTLTGDKNAQDAMVLLRDGEENALFATGTAVPADTKAGYAKGCIFIDTDVATGTGGVYLNKGTSASCVFSLVTQA